MARINDRTGHREEVPRPSSSANGATNGVAGGAPPVAGPTGRFGRPDFTKQTTAAAGGAATTATVGGSFPFLVAFLTDRVWADGAARITGTLTVFLECGQWKGCISCRSTSRKAFLSAGSFQELLERLEEHLTSDDLDWKRDTGGKRS